MRRLHTTTNPRDMNVSKLRERALNATVLGAAELDTT